MSTVLTANRLSDGVVVFLGANSTWVTWIGDAAVHPAGTDSDAVAQAKLDEARQIVVESYPIEVVDKAGVPTPKALREAIRARGPTVRPDLSRPNR